MDGWEGSGMALAEIEQRLDGGVRMNRTAWNEDNKSGLFLDGDCLVWPRRQSKADKARQRQLRRLQRKTTFMWPPSRR